MKKSSKIASVVFISLFSIQASHAGFLWKFKPKKPSTSTVRTKKSSIAGTSLAGLNTIATAMFIVDYANAKSAEQSPNYKNCEEILHEGQVLVVCEKE